MEPVPPPAAVRRDRARSFSRFVEQNSGAARRENAFACSLRAPANADAHERASLHPLAATFSHAGAPSRIDGERSPLAGQFERWSGRRDSNPRPQPWQGCALPLSYTRIRKRVRRPRPQPSYAKERQAWQPLAGPRQELAGGRIRSMGTRSRRSTPAGRPCRRARDRARCGLRAG